jgi:hypothetical protein
MSGKALIGWSSDSEMISGSQRTAVTGHRRTVDTMNRLQSRRDYRDGQMDKGDPLVAGMGVLWEEHGCDEYG